MGSATSSKPLESETQTQTLDTNPLVNDQSPHASNQTAQGPDQSPPALDQLSVSSNEEKVEGGKEGEEEEEGECGFCLFMKGGGCKDAFIAWEDCVESVERDNGDIVDKCFEVTSALKKCMDAHADYYEPILRAEKSAEAEAVKQLEEEKEAASKDKSMEKEIVIEVKREVALEEKSGEKKAVIDVERQAA